MPDLLSVTLPSTSSSERKNAKRVLSDANEVWESTYGLETLPKMCPEANLTPK